MKVKIQDIVESFITLLWSSFEIFLQELRNVLADKGVLVFLVGAFCSYPLLFPYIYKNELVREVPVAVVDLSNSPTSRQLIRMLDGTECVRVTSQLTGFDEAKRDLFSNKVYGIMVIPRDFEARILRSQHTSVAAYIDSSYFMVYKQVLRGMSLASGTMSAGIEIKRMTAKGLTEQAAGRARDPLPLVPVGLFNPSGGYATYVMVGIMIVVLQQTLLIGLGILGGTAHEKHADNYLVPPGFEDKGVWAVLLGKGATYFVLYAFHALYIFAVVFKVFHYPQRGNLILVTFTIFSYLATLIALGLSMTSLFRHRETAIVTLLTFSLPSILSAGFSWPTEAMPPLIRFAVSFIPSVPATDAMIKISQMGASLHEVREPLLKLWGLMVLYSCFAIAAVQRILNRQRASLEL